MEEEFYLLPLHRILVACSFLESLFRVFRVPFSPTNFSSFLLHLLLLLCSSLSWRCCIQAILSFFSPFLLISTCNQIVLRRSEGVVREGLTHSQSFGGNVSESDVMVE